MLPSSNMQNFLQNNEMKKSLCCVRRMGMWMVGFQKLDLITDVLTWSLTGGWLLFLALIWWYESVVLKFWAFFLSSTKYYLSIINQVHSVMYSCLRAHQKMWFLLTKELVSLLSISIKNLQFHASFFLLYQIT